MLFEDQEGCLFIINGKKYIYTGIQKNKKGTMVPTFYGLDGLNNGEINNLTGTNIIDGFENKSQNNADEAVLEIVRSPIYSEYKPGIPQNLRRMPGLTGPAAFYELPGEDGTPRRISDISEKEQMIDPTNPNYVSRVGSNGPSIRYIKEGKIKDIRSFMNDYKKMILKKNPLSSLEMPNPNFGKEKFYGRENAMTPGARQIPMDQSPKPEFKTSNGVVGLEDDGEQLVGRGGRTKRQNKSKTYKNKRYA
jgi:hypothetical protein